MGNAPKPELLCDQDEHFEATLMNQPLKVEVGGQPTSHTHAHGGAPGSPFLAQLASACGWPTSPKGSAVGLEEHKGAKTLLSAYADTIMKR